MATNPGIHSKLQRLQMLAAKGDLHGARQIGEDVLAGGGASPELLHFVGVLACQTGDPRRGAELLRRALAGRPDPAVKLNLARALLDLGDLDEADALCFGARRDAAIAGDMTRLHAEVMRAANRPADAARLLRRVVAANPSDFESWNNLGNALHEAGEIDDAIVALARACSLRPRDATARVNLSRALLTAERHEEALGALSAALELAPDNVDALLDQGRLLTRLHRYRDALPLLGTAARLRKTDPAIFTAIGIAYGALAEFGRAEQAHRMALQVDPAWAPAYLELGMLFEQSNRADDIRQLLRAAHARGVTADDLAYLDALVLRREGAIEQALERARIAPPTIDRNLRAQLIGQLADRVGAYDEAFASFVGMNAEVRRDPVGAHFSPDAYRRSVEALTDLTTREWHDGWRPAGAAIDRAAPVFLVGFPRSGTTLLDTILMGHPDTVVLEEEPLLQHVADMLPDMAAVADLDAAGIRELRAHYFAELDALHPAASGKLVIDKLPLNLLRTPLIARIFPDARFVFAQRHPCDVVLSCFMQNFKINQAMASFLTIEDSALLYDRVLTYWQRCGEVFAMPTHRIVYELLVEDVEAQIRPLLAFLDLPWDEMVLDHAGTAAGRGFIRTPSYAQVAEQIYVRSSGRWEHYRDQMTSVLPILTRWTEAMGYGPVAEAA